MSALTPRYLRFKARQLLLCFCIRQNRSRYLCRNFRIAAPVVLCIPNNSFVAIVHLKTVNQCQVCISSYCAVSVASCVQISCSPAVNVQIVTGKCLACFQVPLLTPRAYSLSLPSTTFVLQKPLSLLRFRVCFYSR